jgi:hypothetical protein
MQAHGKINIGQRRPHTMYIRYVYEVFSMLSRYAKD